MLHNPPIRKPRLLGSVAALAAFVALSGKASAANAAQSTGLLNIDDLPGVVSSELRDDGSVLVRFEDGSLRVLSAGEVIINENGQIFIDPEAVSELALGGGVDPLIIALAVAGVAGAVVAIASSDDDDDDDVIAPPPPPPANVAPVFDSAADVTVDENLTETGLVSVSDADGDAVSFSIAGGADADLFAVDPSTGALTFVEAPDFEAPGDADADNVFEVTVEASDGTNTVQQDITVTLGNVNDNAPVIISGAAFSVLENGVQVGTVEAEDADGDAITFALSGDDAALFTIDADTGVITFVNAPDFENPADADGDNVFNVTVTASDGENEVTQDIAITVTDQSEVIGTAGDDLLIGTAESDLIEGLAGDDIIDSLAGQDFITTGAGADRLLFQGDPFEGADVSAEGRQIVGGEDFISDFDFAEDSYQLDAEDFGVGNDLNFVSLDANAEGAEIPAGSNVIVLVNSDNDGDPDTPFLAGTAAAQIAALVDEPGPGFFVYWNSNLGVNRLVYSTDLSSADADLKILSRQTDLTGQDAIDALPNFTADNFTLFSSVEVGTAEGETITGTEGDDLIEALGGDDVIESLEGSDDITTGTGADILAFSGDPFEGADVSAAGRQIVGGEDFVRDFDFSNDRYQFVGEDVGINAPVSFVSLDANADGAEIPEGANVIVLLNADNDGDPDTPFLAGTAAAQIAGLVSEPGPGFFVYFNTNLGVNRLVYSTDLSSADADLKILSRQTDLTGQDAIDALADFNADNFEILGDFPDPVEDDAGDDAGDGADDGDPGDGGVVDDGVVEGIIGTTGDDSLVGTPGDDNINALAGNDTIRSLAGTDTILTGTGNDILVFEGDPFEGADVSGEGRQIIGGEDDIQDFAFGTAVTTIIVNEGVTSQAVVDAADIGEIYFNIHSTNFPAGEVRGNLTLVEDNRDGNGVGSVTFSAVLNGDNEVPPADTDAEGTGTVTFTIDADGNVTYTTEIEITDFDVSTLTVGHFHEAPVGSNGPVVVDILADARADGSIEGSLVDGDLYQFDAGDLGIDAPVSFVSLDANAPGATIPDGSNVIVLVNSDNDGDPNTPFLAGTAATQIAALVDEPGPGVFVYFNSNLGINRLVYSTDLSSADADLKILSRQSDLTGQDAIDALGDFTSENFLFVGDGTTIGTENDDNLVGTDGVDEIDALGGDDVIESNDGQDIITTGTGEDVLFRDGDPFESNDPSPAGRQIFNTEDFITDFDFTQDRYRFNAADFGVTGTVAFLALDANAPGATITAGTNVIVLLNSDNDGDPNTPFLAGTAANQIAALTEGDGAGFFVYFNSNLGVNRLVYSPNLNDPTADLQVISRQTDLTGQDAIDALAEFGAENFEFAGAGRLLGTPGDDILTGLAGDDIIDSLEGQDTITTGTGRDTLVFAGDPFEGTDVSAAGRDIVGGEDFISDFDFTFDTYQFEGADFGVGTQVNFVSLDATAVDAVIPDGSNVIVLLNSDNDGDPNTPFLAGTAASQIAALVDDPGPGFFVYFNSNLGVNRLVYSTDLSSADADLKIISRQTDLTGQDAIDALADFNAGNFSFVDSNAVAVQAQQLAVAPNVLLADPLDDNEMAAMAQANADAAAGGI